MISATQKHSTPKSSKRMSPEEQYRLFEELGLDKIRFKKKYLGGKELDLAIEAWRRGASYNCLSIYLKRAPTVLSKWIKEANVTLYSKRESTTAKLKKIASNCLHTPVE